MAPQESLKLQQAKMAKKLQICTNIITFYKLKIPSNIKIACLSASVEQYILNPLFCFKRQKFRHRGCKCRKKDKCPKCWVEDHSDSDCACNPKCVICAEHPSLPIKEIPILIKGEEVLKIHFSQYHAKNIFIFL